MVSPAAAVSDVPATARCLGRNAGRLHKYSEPIQGYDAGNLRRQAGSGIRDAYSRRQVIGGGVIGLAIARQLAQRPATTTLLVERHNAIGTETSARNSGVLHAGIFYEPRSLKAQLCLRGKALLERLCTRHGIAYRRTGKWIVAQTSAQAAALVQLEARAGTDPGGLGVPLRWLSAAEVVHCGHGVRAAAAALDCPSSGIVDVHGLMLCLLGLFEAAGGTVALHSAVDDVRPLEAAPALSGSAGWAVRVRGPQADEPAACVTAETLVNAAGLGAVAVHNMIVPPARRRRAFFAKGSYFTCALPLSMSRLVYPVSNPGAASLGIHLTLDLAGRIRFGPDVEWVDHPNHLAVGPTHLLRAVAAIAEYMPAIDAASLAPDYAGIRPKLTGPGQLAHDFVISIPEGYRAWVDCLGIESPGLTSSLAIAQHVEQLLYGSITTSP